MYKVLIFLDGSFSDIENELNNLHGYEIIHIWQASGRIGILLKGQSNVKEAKKPGRPKKEETVQETEE